MSEEILKALMQLFALITKQDGGISDQEIDYVKRFLEQQIGVDSAGEYLELFIAAGKEKEQEETSEESPDEKGRLTSVLDSVRVLKLCKKISKTINQRQKVVVLVRILELINSEYKLTDQRLGIVRTVSDIFRIQKEEYESIFTFVTSADVKKFSHANHLALQAAGNEPEDLFFLRVPSVELYFLKYLGEQEVFSERVTDPSADHLSFCHREFPQTPCGTARLLQRRYRTVSFGGYPGKHLL